MEDQSEEINHSAAQKDKKVENISSETWRIQRRVPAGGNKEKGTKAIFAGKWTEHFPESKGLHS